MSEMEPVRGHLVRGYTVALGSIAVLATLGSLTVYSTAHAPTTNPDARWALVFSAQLTLAFALLAGFVVYLRVRASEYAKGATTAISILLAIYFPFGTAVFVYWLLRVRKLESAA